MTGARTLGLNSSKSIIFVGLTACEATHGWSAGLNSAYRPFHASAQVPPAAPDPKIPAADLLGGRQRPHCTPAPEGGGRKKAETAQLGLQRADGAPAAGRPGRSGIG